MEKHVSQSERQGRPSYWRYSAGHVVRENSGSVTLPRSSKKPQLQTSSYALVVFLGCLSFQPHVTPSAAPSPTTVKQMPFSYPPVADTNTSFPVTWHRGNRKLGQMGD